MCIAATTSRFSAFMNKSLFTHSCYAATVTAICLLAWITTMLYSNGILLIGIFLTGGAGGVLSNYFRIKGNSDPNDVRFKELRKTDDKPDLVIQIYISVVIGGLLAWAGHLIFASGLIKNEAFPAYNMGEKYLYAKSILDVAPTSANEAIKSLFWSLVFGFSEKLIPNIIDDYTSTLDKFVKSSRSEKI
jgi:hypothetical protein